MRRPGLRVETDRRLVEEQHPRRVHQPAGDLQPAAHAAGVRLHAWLAALPEPDHLEDLRMRASVHVALGMPVQLGVEAQVLLGGEVHVERGVLEDEPDVAAHVEPLGTMSWPATTADPAVGSASVQSILMVVDLPAPLGPRKPKISPGADVERDAVDGGELAVALDEPADLHRGSGRLS